MKEREIITEKLTHVDTKEIYLKETALISSRDPVGPVFKNELNELSIYNWNTTS